MQRQTKQRMAVIAMLKETYSFCSAQQLHAALKAKGSSIGLATVYRNLDSLAEAGEVNVIRSEDGELLYRFCEDDDHHHHLVCRQCGKIVRLDSDAFEQWVHSVAAENGFTDVSHFGDLFGLCADCSSSS